MARYGKGMRDCCDSVAKEGVPHIKGCPNATPATSDTDVPAIKRYWPVMVPNGRIMDPGIKEGVNGRLVLYKDHEVVVSDLATALQAKEERIRELEAELEQWSAWAEGLTPAEISNGWKTKLSTIEADTIERCAKVAEEECRAAAGHVHPTGVAVAAAIRSLQGEGK